MASIATKPQRVAPPRSRSGATARRIISAPLPRVVGRRLLQAIPVLLGVSLITRFLLTELPGTAASALLPPGASKQQVATLGRQLGLDRPFFTQYFDWLGQALRGHFGASLASEQPVSQIIDQRLPVSLELIVLAFVISLAVAVPVAVLGARRPGGPIDRLNVVIGMIGLSIPMFVLGLVLVLVFAVDLKVLPAEGFTSLGSGLGPNLKEMILPSVTIAFPLFCHYTRILRADIVDQMNSGEYIVAARAKGIGPWRILLRHALRNSVFPTLTLVGLNLGTMIGSTVVVEQIFGLPGLGQELVSAVQTKDVPIVTAIVLLLAVAVILANLLTDILIAVLDPRLHGTTHG